MRGAIYVRQSRTTDGSSSMPIQEAACRSAAASHAVRVVAVLQERDSTSGYKDRGRSRPKFAELIGLISDGSIDCVIVYKTDRLSRGGGPGYAPLLDAAEARGLDIDTLVLHPGGWVTELELGIRATMDREESAKISSRMRDVREREARAGMARVGGRRFGYRYDKEAKKLVVIPEEAAVIREAMDRIQQGESVYGLAQDLNRRGVPSARGGLWKTAVLKNLVQSPGLAGLRTHKGQVVAVGDWEPIVDEDTLARVAVALGQTRTHARPARTYLLTGVLRCGQCGKPMRSTTTGPRRRYACRREEGAGGCGKVVVKAEFVEDAVAPVVLERLGDSTLRAGMASSADGREALVQIGALEQRRRAFHDEVAEGTVDPREVRRFNKRIDEQLAPLRAAFHGSSLPGLPLDPVELGRLWDEGTLTFRRHLVLTVIDHILVNPVRKRLGPGVFDADRLVWKFRGRRTNAS